jgi:hypothetical protein
MRTAARPGARPPNAERRPARGGAPSNKTTTPFYSTGDAAQESAVAWLRRRYGVAYSVAIVIAVGAGLGLGGAR